MHRSQRASPADPRMLPPLGPLDLPRTSEMSSRVTVREAHPKGGGELQFQSHLQSPPKGTQGLIQRAPRHSQHQVQSEALRRHHPLSALTAQRNPNLFPYPICISESSLPPRGIRPLLHLLAHTGRPLLPTHIQTHSFHLGSSQHSSQSSWRTSASPQRPVSCGPDYGAIMV